MTCSGTASPISIRIGIKIKCAMLKDAKAERYSVFGITEDSFNNEEMSICRSMQRTARDGFGGEFIQASVHA